MTSYRASVFVAGSVAAMASISSAACGQQPAQAPLALYTRFRVDVVTQVGSPVTDATVTVKLFNPVGVVLDSSVGQTDQSGSYLMYRADPLEGIYPVTVRVDPPAGMGLSSAQVNDSTEYGRLPVPTRVVTVTLTP